MVELSWSVPNVTNGILLYYTVVYTNNTDTLIVVHDNGTFSDIITNLNEDTFYSFMIYANTSAGVGRNSTYTIITFQNREFLIIQALLNQACWPKASVHLVS